MLLYRKHTCFDVIICHWLLFGMKDLFYIWMLHYPHTENYLIKPAYDDNNHRNIRINIPFLRKTLVSYIIPLLKLVLVAKIQILHFIQLVSNSAFWGWVGLGDLSSLKLSLVAVKSCCYFQDLFSSVIEVNIPAYFIPSRCHGVRQFRAVKCCFISSGVTSPIYRVFK